MTRDLNWGVDVPSGIAGAEGKKLYVWMDAPIGYVSATKHWAEKNNKDWKIYWQDEETALVHFIGKDNIVFHCLIFPAILKAKGNYNLPINVPANQFMNLEGEKISTSRNWAVWVNDYISDFPDQTDVLRYNLIRNMPELKDSEFTWKNYQDTNNNELVNNIGNFVNRVVVLTNKFYKGEVPEFDQDAMFNGVWDQDFGGFHETEMLGLHDDLQELNIHFRKFDFRGALRILMEISSKGNQLLQVNEPWKYTEEDPEAVKALMNLLLQIITALSVAIRPFMPFTADKLRKLLKLPLLSEKGELLEALDRLSLGEQLIDTGHKIGKPVHLFTRIEDDIISRQLDKLKESSTPDTQKALSSRDKSKEKEVKKEVKPSIEYEDFAKLDIRTGTIVSAEKVEGSDKLMKLIVDIGTEERDVVAGISGQFSPDDAANRRILLLTNLKPRKIRGLMSNGMILMAEGKNGKMVFVSPDEGIENGSTVA
jgi:methionyl-tRNA synthetase